MRLLMLVVCGLTLMITAGCSTTDGLTVFKNRDYSDPTDGPDDPWISNVGTETKERGVRKNEKSGEATWFRELTMSDRAREIESNLGIED